MKRFQYIIQKYITNHQKHKKYLAAVLALSILVSFGVSAGLIMPAVSMTKPNNNIIKPMVYANGQTSNAGNIPAGAIDIGPYITNVEQLNSGVQVVDGKKDITFSMEFVLNDTGNLPSPSNPYVYLKLPKGEIDVTQDYFDATNIVMDNTDEWTKYKRDNGAIPSYLQAGTYKIYKTADDFALILIEFYPEYAQFIQDSKGVKGSLDFDGKVGRADTQEGDRTVNVGDEQITIDFDPAELSINKNGRQQIENGNLYIDWTIVVHDLYELSNYDLVDTMLNGEHEVVSFSCTPDVFGYDLNYGGLVTKENSTSADTITITYRTKVTPDQIKDGKVNNECHIEGTTVRFEKEVTLDVDPRAHIAKSGKPSYTIENEKGYIEWTIDVYRDFGMTLDGYKITDRMLTSDGIVSIVDDKGNDITDKCNVSEGTLIFDENVDFSKATIKYKTEVAPNAEVNVENKATIYPSGNTPPPDDETPDIPVKYDGDDLFKVEKIGSFNADNTGDDDYIGWQVIIDATEKQDSKINLNGYNIHDDVLSRSDCTITKVEAWNNNSPINNASKDTLLFKSGSDYVVKNTPEVDKIILTYRVPLTEDEIRRRANLGQGEFVQVHNAVKVTPPDGGEEEDSETVDVPGVAGNMTVNANKNWVGNDPNRITDASKTVTLKLYQRLGTDGEWVEYGEKNVPSGTTVKWEHLPERDSSKTPYYYKVVEVNTPSDYTASYSVNDNGVSSAQNGKNPTITVINTWNNINMGVIKNWNGIDYASKPDTIKFRLEKSTDRNNWTTVDTITLTKSGNYADDAFDPVPKKEGNNTVYYRVVELDASDNPVKDFDVTYMNEWYNDVSNGVDVSNWNGDYNFNVTNTWRNMNVSVNKSWAGDEGNENKRPTSIELTLWQKVGNNNWESTGKTATVSNYGEDVKCFSNLPKYAEDGVTQIQYKVVETPVNGYYVTGDNESLNNTGTIHLTNNYSMMQIKAEKRWNNVPETERPATIKLRLMWSSNAWAADEEWQEVDGIEDKIVSKGNDGNFPESVWNDLPKRDENGNPIYYKVVEVDNNDFTVSYAIDGNIQNYNGINENGKFIITNTWNYMNLKVNKTWSDANPDLRPDEIVLTLKKRVGNGSWSDITAKDKEGLWKGVTSVITLKKANDGNYYIDGDTSKPADSYEWKKLPAENADGYSVSYKVEETPVPGYDVRYSDARNSSGDFNITNTSNFIDITVSKGWKDVNNNQKPDSVKFKLIRSTDNKKPESEWEEVADSEEVLTINKDDEYSSLTWSNLPGKDTGGKKYYYKVVETEITKDDENVKSEYDMSCSPDYASSDNKNLTVTNTWKKMNLSVRKDWQDFDEITENFVTVSLQQKIGENGEWEDVNGANSVTINSNDSNSWIYENAWTELPKTTDDGQIIYYRAVEDVPSDAPYFAEYDEVGKNSSGYSVITNKYNFIDITVKKVWEPEVPFYATKASTVKFYLQKTTNGGATWQKVDYNCDGTFDEADKIVLDGDEEFNTGASWENLLIKDGDNDVVYRVVEEAVDGFSASYSIDGTNFKSAVDVDATSTVTVKNTENSPYSKFGISASPNEFEISGNGQPENFKQDNTLVSSIKPDQLANQIVDIDGEKYYLFKWRINLDRNQVNGGQNNMTYYFEDTLPKDTILYTDRHEKDYGNGNIRIEDSPEYYVLWGASYNQSVLSPISKKDIPLLPSDNGYSYAYDTENRKIFFDLTKNVAFITYYTATLKSTVDAELEKNGSFVLENQIKEQNEKVPSKATITVKDDENADYIDKKNTTTKELMLGASDVFNGKVRYVLDINKDGKFLSNGKTINLTDVFHIIRYQPNGEEEQQGRNLLDASLASVIVREVDSNGNKPIINDYSYATKEEDGYYTVEHSAVSFTADNVNVMNNGVQFAAWTMDLPKGLEVEIQFTGANPGEEILFEDASFNLVKSYTFEKDGKEILKLESLDTHFDGDGKGRIKLTVLDDITGGPNSIIGIVKINGIPTGNDLNNRHINIIVLNQAIKQNNPVTDNVLNLTVPDGKHLIVEYEYSIKKTDGTALTAGDVVTVGNSATIHTSGGDKTSTSDESKFTMVNSGAQSSTNLIPKIKKIDSGNYSIKNLKATFKFAKWNGSSWEYAKSFPFITDEKGKVTVSKTDHEIIYGATGFADAGELKVENGSYNIQLESGTLYKLVEIKAPDGYLKTEYEKNNTPESAYDTYYFMYDGQLSDLENKPDINESGVQKIQALGSVEIGNTKPIKIGAEKVWEQLPAKGDALNNVSIQVQLFSSATKSADIPADAQAVADAGKYVSGDIDSSSVDNDGRVTIKAKYDSTTKSYVWKQDVIWQDLPNGEDGKPIYYYVKEVAYSIDGTTYTDNGAYKPTYSNNGTNEDGVVKITNSKRFLIKKVWMNLDGTIMKSPPESDIEFTLTGYTADGTEVPIALGSDNKLTAANNWQVEIPQSLVNQYVRFKITEVNPPYFYTVSDVYELNGTVGTVKLINQDRSISKVDVQVNKNWGDGSDVHKNDNITVTLYKSTTYYSNEDIKNFEKVRPKDVKLVSTVDPENPIKNPQILNTDNNWSYTWTNLPYKENVNGEPKVVYYYVVETKATITGTHTYVSSYNYVNKGGSVQKMEITNSLPDSLTIKKKWFDNDENELNSGTHKQVEVELYRQTVTTANSSSPSTTTTTANPSQQPIKIMAIGDSITDGFGVVSYRKQLYLDLVDTYGYKDQNGNSLIDMVGSLPEHPSYNPGYDENHEGYSQHSIMTYDGTGRIGIYEKLIQKDSISGDNIPDVVLLMIGTNDIIDNKMGDVSYNGNYIGTIDQRLETLVNYIFSKYSNPQEDVTLFISSIPPMGLNSGWLNNNYSGTPGEKQASVNANIATYNGYIKSLVESKKSAGYDIAYLDVNSQMTLDDLNDGDQIHPHANGHIKMGSYFAKQIASYLGTGHLAEDDNPEQSGEDTPETPDDNTEIDFSKMELVTSVGNNGRINITASEGWSYSVTDLPAYDEDGNKYAYYIKEVDGDDYDVVYENNTGQSLDNAKIITIKNTTDGTAISVTATKTWNKNGVNNIELPEQVGFQLMSSAVENGTPEAVSGEDIQYANASNGWTVTWENLPATKFYSVQEVDLPDGWTVSSNNQTQDDDGNISVEITNTLDIGSLEVEKSWYQDDDGGNTSVDVELYRISEDKIGSAEPQSVAETPISRRFSLQSTAKIMSKAMAVTPRDATTNNERIAGTLESVIANEYNMGDYEYDVPSDCNGKKITSIKVELGAGIDPTAWNAGSLKVRVKIGDTYYETDTWNPNNTTVGTIDATGKIATIPASSFYILNSWPFEYLSSLENITKIEFVYLRDGNHSIDKVDFCYIPDETLELKYGIKTADIDNPTITDVTMTAGDTLTITASHPILNEKPSIEWKSSNESVATVTGDNDGVVVTALSAGNVTITAKDDTAERNVIIRVDPFKIIQDNGSELTSIELTESEEHTFKSNSSGSVNWTIVGDKNGSLFEGSKFKAGQMGTVYIKAINNGIKSNTVTVIINSRDFHFNEETCLMHISSNEKTFSLYDNNNESVTGGIVWTVEDNDNILDYWKLSENLNSIIVKALHDGTVKITATRGEGENAQKAELMLEVAPLTILEETLKLSLNEIRTLTATKVVGELTWASDMPGIVSVDENGRITANAGGEATITVTDTANGTATCTVNVVIKQAEVSIPANVESLGAKTISSSNGWKEQWKDLPLTDGKGHKYIYYIKETSTGNYIPISYSENGIQLENDNVKTLKITNKVDKDEKPVTMPSTGGTGTTWYYITGMALMFIPVVILVRRRKKST